jgi:hypothetical protein
MKAALGITHPHHSRQGMGVFLSRGNGDGTLDAKFESGIPFSNQTGSFIEFPYSLEGKGQGGGIADGSDWLQRPTPTTPVKGGEFFFQAGRAYGAFDWELQAHGHGQRPCPGRMRGDLEGFPLIEGAVWGSRWRRRWMESEGGAGDFQGRAFQGWIQGQLHLRLHLKNIGDQA